MSATLSLMREDAVPEAQVTMPVSQLADLVKHAQNTLFWMNLPRKNDSFHRCLRFVLIEYPEPTITFELQEDSRVVRTVTHTLDALFDLLPRLEVFLRTQVP